MARLFVAVWPPAAVLDGLELLPRAPLAGARWTTRPQWHVTLRYFGVVDEKRALEAFGAVRAPAVTAVAGPGARRLGRNVLVLPVAGLEPLAAAVDDAMGDLGPTRDHPFTGHLTLARAGRGTLPRLDVPIDATWTVQEVALVDSHLHPAGAVYDTLSVCRLDGGG